MRPAIVGNGLKCYRIFGLASNPESLREGNAIKDTLEPDRIVIREVVDRLPPILRTTPENAGMIKYANNAFLAMKVTSANMFAMLCKRVPGADVDIVMRGIELDKRIGPDFLYPGWPRRYLAV